jgi:hypothetical protein
MKVGIVDRMKDILLAHVWVNVMDWSSTTREAGTLAILKTCSTRYTASQRMAR